MIKALLLETTLKMSEMRVKNSGILSDIINRRLNEIFDYVENLNELKKEDISHLRTLNSVVLVEILVFIMNNGKLDKNQLKANISNSLNIQIIQAYNRFISEKNPLKTQLKDQIDNLTQDLRYLADFENKLTEKKINELSLFFDRSLELFMMIYWKFGFNGKYFESSRDENRFLNGIFQDISNLLFIVSLEKEEMMKLFFEMSGKNAVYDFEKNTKYIIGEILND